MERGEPVIRGMVNDIGFGSFDRIEKTGIVVDLVALEVSFLLLRWVVRLFFARILFLGSVLRFGGVCVARHRVAWKGNDLLIRRPV